MVTQTAMAEATAGAQTVMVVEEAPTVAAVPMVVATEAEAEVELEATECRHSALT